MMTLILQATSPNQVLVTTLRRRGGERGNTMSIEKAYGRLRIQKNTIGEVGEQFMFVWKVWKPAEEVAFFFIIVLIKGLD